MNSPIPVPKLIPSCTGFVCKCVGTYKFCIPLNSCMKCYNKDCIRCDGNNKLPCMKKINIPNLGSKTKK